MADSTRFSPGEVLRDELEARGWTVTEFAEIVDRPVQAISEIVNAKKEITADTAVQFGAALRTSPEFWLNLQTRYRLRNASNVAQIPLVARRAQLRSVAPIAELRRRGWITDVDDIDALESEVCDLYGIATVTEDPSFLVAARTSRRDQGLRPEQVAWLAFVRRQGERTPTAAFDRHALADVAARLPRILIDGPTLVGDVAGLLAACGVVLVIEPGLSGGKLDGAAMRLKDGRFVVGLTVRIDRFDSYLFTLLHEIAHIINGDLDGDDEWCLDEALSERGAGTERETAADLQAGRWLLPDSLIVPPNPTAQWVRSTANEHGVHPSVVIGRAQHDLKRWTLFKAHIPKVRSVLLAKEQPR